MKTGLICNENKEFARKDMEYPDFQSVEGCHVFSPATSRSDTCNIAPRLYLCGVKVCAGLDPKGKKPLNPIAGKKFPCGLLFPKSPGFHKALFIFLFLKLYLWKSSTYDVQKAFRVQLPRKCAGTSEKMR